MWWLLAKPFISFCVAWYFILLSAALLDLLRVVLKKKINHIREQLAIRRIKEVISRAGALSVRVTEMVPPSDPAPLNGLSMALPHIIDFDHDNRHYYGELVIKTQDPEPEVTPEPKGNEECQSIKGLPFQIRGRSTRTRRYVRHYDTD